MKETITKKLLDILTEGEEVKIPLNEDIAARLAVYIEAFRYMIAFYVDESKDSSCNKEFIHYLKTIIEVEESIHSWPNDDINYLHKVSPKFVYFDEPEKVFNKIKSMIRMVC